MYDGTVDFGYKGLIDPVPSGLISEVYCTMMRRLGYQTTHTHTHTAAGVNVFTN